MPSKNQSNTDSKEYPSKEAETVSRWSRDMLLNVIPENKESALKYWNEANKQGCSQDVKDHFKACLSRFKE